MTKLITIQEAHEQYDIPLATIYYRIHKNSLKGYELNNKWYVDPDDFVEWLSTHSLRRGEALEQVPILHEQGMTDSEMSVALGVSRQRIHQLRNKLELKANPRKPRLPKGTYKI